MLSFGSLRPRRIDRAGATLVGATTMVAFGVLTPAQAVAAMDFHTLALLFGMMIVAAHLRLAGFFAWVAVRVLTWARTPTDLLAAVTVLSGTLSALFVNVPAVLLLQAGPRASPTPGTRGWRSPATSRSWARSPASS